MAHDRSCSYAAGLSCKMFHLWKTRMTGYIEFGQELIVRCLGYVCFVRTIRSKSHFLDMENLVQGGRVIVGIAAGPSRADWMGGIIQPSPWNKCIYDFVSLFSAPSRVLLSQPSLSKHLYHWKIWILSWCPLYGSSLWGFWEAYTSHDTSPVINCGAAYSLALL